ncbi:hypothetical protein ACTQ5R_10620 [Ruoffia tabacinasalis]|uniref:hypothetical protein n=1 Tax=Ruoffia tabacinasalis TaxID=87458 RepID=UPI003F99E530
MNKVNNFQHLNDTITDELSPLLYINAFPKNEDFKRLLLQIVVHLRALNVHNNILYKDNDPSPLQSFEIPHKDFVNGKLNMYEVIKRLKSQKNIYEGRERLGNTVNPRWIFFPFQEERNSIVFTFYFEKVFNDSETDNTQ